MSGLVQCRLLLPWKYTMTFHVKMLCCEWSCLAVSWNQFAKQILDHWNTEMHFPLFTSITALEKMLAKSYGIRHPGRFCSELFNMAFLFSKRKGMSATLVCSYCDLIRSTKKIRVGSLSFSIFTLMNFWFPSNNHLEYTAQGKRSIFVVFFGLNNGL